jgi:hypothetical protein
MKKHLPGVEDAHALIRAAREALHDLRDRDMDPAWRTILAGRVLQARKVLGAATSKYVVLFAALDTAAVIVINWQEMPRAALDQVVLRIVANEFGSLYPDIFAAMDKVHLAKAISDWPLRSGRAGKKLEALRLALDPTEFSPSYYTLATEFHKWRKNHP